MPILILGASPLRAANQAAAWRLDRAVFSRPFAVVRTFGRHPGQSFGHAFPTFALIPAGHKPIIRLGRERQSARTASSTSST